MSPSIAAHVLDAMTTRQSTGESSALQKLTITINLVVQQKTYQQAGLIAARLREEAAELDKGEMDNLVVQIREAQELNAC